MPLNKDVAAWLARQVPAESLSLAALRHQTDLSLITQQGEARDGHYQHSFTFPASDGHAITVRVYVPCALEQETGRPALIWAHGEDGAWAASRRGTDPAACWQKTPGAWYFLSTTGLHRNTAGPCR